MGPSASGCACAGPAVLKALLYVGVYSVVTG